MLSSFGAFTNDWVKDRDSGNLRRHRAHYDVIVMIPQYPIPPKLPSESGCQQLIIYIYVCVCAYAFWLFDFT